METELWLRPWAARVPSRRVTLEGFAREIAGDHAAPVYLQRADGAAPVVDGRNDVVELAMEIDGALWLLPFPVRRQPGAAVGSALHTCLLAWPDAPERPDDRLPPGEQDPIARALMLRAEAVWDRIDDVDEALADPGRLWDYLRERWIGRDSGEPRMDVIVRHAEEVVQVLDVLEARPRRILRRVHKTVPISRVQEIDRRAMLWLARQPGETLAERAGLGQRVLAVAREENFDTLENRVLRAYGELAARHAREYLDRKRTRKKTRRARLVEVFGRRCQRMARTLEGRGVRVAEPGVTPNFVLQQNPRYLAVWRAWGELVRREQRKDELWRWQARSWEEFCSLVVMVALTGVNEARVVASAPLWKLDEHRRGKWIEADAPLGVVYLPRPNLVIEVLHGPRPGTVPSGLGAALWLRLERVGRTREVVGHLPVWPLWSIDGGLSEGEADELADVIGYGQDASVMGGLVLRPAKHPDQAEVDRAGNVLVVTVGTEGDALRNSLQLIVELLTSLVGTTAE